MVARKAFEGRAPVAAAGGRGIRDSNLHSHVQCGVCSAKGCPGIENGWFPQAAQR